MHLVVNSLTVNTNVKLTYNSDREKVGTILESKDNSVIAEEEWPWAINTVHQPLV